MMVGWEVCYYLGQELDNCGLMEESIDGEVCDWCNENMKETKEHLLEWVKNAHGVFAWPTDACGYDQHIKFVKHRNKSWVGGDFKKFVSDYANSL